MVQFALFSATTTATAASGPGVSILPLSAMDDPSAAPFYSPQTITVVVGVNNTITWVNNDDSPHKVTVSDGSFNSGNLVPRAN